MPDNEPLLVLEDWEHAIAEARAGRPALLAFKVSRRAIPLKHRKAVAEIIAKPRADAVRSRILDKGMRLLIRREYAILVSKYEKTPHIQRPVEKAYAELAKKMGMGLTVGRLEDVVQCKKSYAKYKGELP